MVLKDPAGDELPPKGFDPGEDTYQAPAKEGRENVKVRWLPPSAAAHLQCTSAQLQCEVAAPGKGALTLKLLAWLGFN